MVRRMVRKTVRKMSEKIVGAATAREELPLEKLEGDAAFAECALVERVPAEFVRFAGGAQ
jgi:hypothetical protein